MMTKTINDCVGNRKKVSQGFTLVELLVVMVIFIIVIAITGNAFNLIQKQAALQSKTAESNIEGVVGLEIMRKDLASAGFGLPWSFQKSISYLEADTTKAPLAFAYNDAPSNAPRAVSGGNNLTPGDATKLLDGSDYLVIRSTSVGITQASQSWSYMNYTSVVKPASPILPKSWTLENLQKGDLVIVETMDFTPPTSKVLVMDSTAINVFSAKYPDTAELTLANFEPTTSRATNYVYGVYHPDNGDVTSLRMPFNRADYYVRTPSTTESVKLPGRCAPNTGILFKAVVSQKDGSLSELPLLDCVADMQVVYSLYDDSTGVTSDTDVLSATLSAADIRTKLKAIKVYILTHDGGKDKGFTYSDQLIAVGPSADGINTGSGRQVNLQTMISTGWQNYRWKVYRMIVNLSNMDSSTQ
ncbi:MAG TPA: prepilin-type N-terminal cleavage/methylation domain-containing protein [Geobacteraceae bacterium]|nr:prepilin-type N-terminal cleavage/methylation domain-containing protein [Geobacteraceae bacterium]